MTTALRPNSQNARILAVLKDGREHTMQEVHALAGFCRLNSRISELRSRGYTISCRRHGNDYIYRLEASSTQAESFSHSGAPVMQPGAGGGDSAYADDSNSSEREPKADTCCGESSDPRPSRPSSACLGEQPSRSVKDSAPGSPTPSLKPGAEQLLLEVYA